MPRPLRVRFLRTASGPDFGPFSPGQEADLPYARARDLIDSGAAVALGSVGPEHDEPEEKPVRVERAVRRQPEAAVAPPQREHPAPERRAPEPVRAVESSEKSSDPKTDPKTDAPAVGKK
jgi:hypothetical protein